MKKRLVVILIALLIGFGLSYFLFKRDDSDKYISAFQVGVFSSYANAKKCAERNEGIIVNDNGMYRVYVSVSSSDKNRLALEKYYSENNTKYYLRRIHVSKDLYNSLKAKERKVDNIDSYLDIRYQLLLEYKDSL